MKKIVYILTFFSFVTLLSCGQSDSNDANDSDLITVEQEKELAKEATEESKAAKEEAADTEESIDKLLEDI